MIWMWKIPSKALCVFKVALVLYSLEKLKLLWVHISVSQAALQIQRDQGWVAITFTCKGRNIGNYKLSSEKVSYAIDYILPHCTLLESFVYGYITVT